MEKGNDYVVIGGGTAGSVIAARLSEDPGIRVALLEAGAEEGPALMAEPDMGASFGMWGTPVDWAYTTTPQPGTEGHVHTWPRGRVLGGSSSINGLIHLRGHASSYDAWEKQGATGWNFAAMLPFLIRSERAEGRDPHVRGQEGPMVIDAPPPSDPLTRAFYDAALEAGFPSVDDGNSPGPEGVFWAERTVTDGHRQSAADAYLRPVLSRPNLSVVTGAQVQRLLIDHGRCHGAQYVQDGAEHTLHAEREVVLSAGTVGSPQLLLLSGVGPADHLRATGIPVRHDLPGVGANLHDHPLSLVSCRLKQPPGFSAPARPILFARTTQDADPDVQMMPGHGAMKPRWSGREDGFSILFSLVVPSSRGSLRLRDADPASYPLIDPAYLTDPVDVTRMVTALRIARRLTQADALSAWLADEVLPGRDIQDDDASRAYIRHTATTYFHPVGTCRIGTDEGAVVDTDLRVRGVEGLRVADASVMPSIVSGNTNAAVLGIAEKAAHLLTLASDAHQGRRTRRGRAVSGPEAGGCASRR
jgi:choline dehydrogenase